ncbi:MAG: hypothetical protein AAGI08_03330 [Bacteroidota bacterium]
MSRFLFVLFALAGFAQSLVAQDPPAQAERFEPGVIAKDHWSFTPTFTPDYNTLYYARWRYPDRTPEPGQHQRLYVSHRIEGGWSEPEEVDATRDWRVDWPHISADGRFFLSFAKAHPGHYGYPDRMVTRDPRVSDFDLWVAPIGTDGVEWSQFAPIDSPGINRPKTPDNAKRGYVHNETGPATDTTGTLYFWTERLDDGGGRRDLYAAAPTATGWDKPTLLPAPLNSRYNESGLCVAPDGSWIIFASERPGGFGESDLYLSRRTETGWSTPANLGPAVNTSAGEAHPELAPDGRALFFTSNRPIAGVPESPGVDGRLGPVLNPYWVALESLGL